MKWLSFVFLLLLLSACGGSSDSSDSNSTDVDVSENSNEEEIVVEAPVKLLTTIDSSNSQDIVNAFADIVSAIVLSSRPIQDYIGTKSYSCIRGDFTTLTDVLSASASLNFNRCWTDYITRYHGQLILTNPLLAPTVGFDIEFVNLKVIKENIFPIGIGQAFTTNGTIRIVLDPSINGSTYTIEGSSIDVENNLEDALGTHTFKNFSITVKTNPFGDMTIQGSGDLTSTKFSDIVEISTPLAFEREVTDRRYPNTGQLTFGGANNTHISIHANGGQGFTPEIDQTSIDTNSVFINKSWADLRDWMGL